jgi:hypothetical protein
MAQSNTGKSLSKYTVDADCLNHQIEFLLDWRGAGKSKPINDNGFAGF